MHGSVSYARARELLRAEGGESVDRHFEEENGGRSDRTDQQQEGQRGRKHEYVAAGAAPPCTKNPTIQPASGNAALPCWGRRLTITWFRGRGYENADGKCRRTEMSRQEQDGQHRAQEPVENQDAEDDRVEPRQRRSCRGVRVVLDRRHGFDSGLSVVIARARGPSRQAPRLAPEKHEADQGTGGNPSRVSK